MGSEPVSLSPDKSDALAALKALVLRIDSEGRFEELVKYAKELGTEEQHALVDGLCAALNDDTTPTRTLRHIWSALISIASTSNLFARSRTLNYQRLSPSNDASIYTIQGDSSKCVKILRQAKEGASRHCQKLVHWAHISHPNILPLYAAFLEGEGQPCFVSPHTSNTTICEYATGVEQPQRLALLLDVAAGLDYMHQAGLIHGGLIPNTVLIADGGRAVITALDSTSEIEGWDMVPPRYAAPEILKDDETPPTKAIDMWFLGCLGYQLMSGNTPYFHISRDVRVAAAIAAGDKPIRPGQDGNGGQEIVDAVWNELLSCWASESDKRPDCSHVHRVLLAAVGTQDRSVPQSTNQLGVLEVPIVGLERAQTLLAMVLSTGSGQTSEITVPKHLQTALTKLTKTVSKCNATEAAAKKLSPGDTQVLVDLLGLVVRDLRPADLRPTKGAAPARLISSIISSTHVFPHWYKLDGVQYDPAETIGENAFAKAYKGRGVNVRVSLVTDSGLPTAEIFKWLAVWANAPHPNLSPFHGVFHEPQNASPRICVVSPLLINGTLRDYAPTLPQKSRLPLLSDVVHGLVYLHTALDIKTGGLEGDRILISDQGRAMLSTFGDQFSFRRAQTEAQHQGYSVRFLGPREVWSDPVAKDKWSFGCVCYETLSQNDPYHGLDDSQANAARERGELPTRPNHSEDGTDEIDDKGWNLITRCCTKKSDQPTFQEIQAMVDELVEEDNRPAAKPLPAPEILALRSRPDVDFDRAEAVVNKIQLDLLRGPLKSLIQNRTKAVAAAVAELERDDVRSIVNFLDQALKDHLKIADERNRVLGLLSRITSLTHVFPQQYELQGVTYQRVAVAEGGFGRVHQGTDPSVCVKVMTRLDPDALMPWVKEVILWAHSSHPNVLPFHGVFLDGPVNMPQTCLVSPFMKNGNLHYYSRRLPQKARLPLISDVVEGLHYLHDVGIVHGDLKGENVLISDEGRCLITDFGTSHINTATAATIGSLSATTLRFSAPETIGGNRKATKEYDIWSLGCLKYEILSKKQPYHQYTRDFQIAAALARGEIPERPGSAKDEEEKEDDGWDDPFEQDGDMIDDQLWALIVGCCAFKPEDRPSMEAVRELIIDLKIWDDRPAAKPISTEAVSKLRSKFRIDLSRVEDLLAEIQWRAGLDALKFSAESLLVEIQRQIDSDIHQASVGSPTPKASSHVDLSQIEELFATTRRKIDALKAMKSQPL